LAPRTSVTLNYEAESPFFHHERGKESEQKKMVIAVGTVIADRPPHRSVRAALPHTALTLDVDLQTAR